MPRNSKQKILKLKTLLVSGSRKSNGNSSWAACGAGAFIVSGYLMIPVYRIKNWDQIYENNRTRELKTLLWLALPIKLNGDGYTMIMEEHNGQKGPAIFGAWIALVEIAANCNPRGTLIRSNGEPHSSRTIMRQSRIDLAVIDSMLEFCLQKCKWLELIDLESGAIIPQEDATISQDPAEKPPYRKEGNELEQERNIYKKFSHLSMTNDEFEELRKLGFSKEEIDEKILELKNYKKNTKYASMYLTLRKWLKKDIQTEEDDFWPKLDDKD